jgi:hypothetical protein
MAKQTFTTGQVLTAAQMTSLQQTAMGGGSATAKTASYVLVAADAGSTVIMNSASATTVTVNTALFAAGDTVYIQNIGAGISTITAGTATVTTSASLALAQWEGGNLYFTSASAAIFVKGAGAAAASGAYTSLASGTLSLTATDLTSISQAYTDLYLVVVGAYFITTASQCVFRYNSDSGTNYNSWFALLTSTTPISEVDKTYTQTTRNNVATSANDSTSILYIRNYATTSAKQITATFSTITDAGAGNYWSFGSYESSTAISAISIRSSNGTSVFGGGTYTLYGVK